MAAGGESVDADINELLLLGLPVARIHRMINERHSIDRGLRAFQVYVKSRKAKAEARERVKALAIQRGQEFIASINQAPTSTPAATKPAPSSSEAPRIAEEQYNGKACAQWAEEIASQLREVETKHSPMVDEVLGTFVALQAQKMERDSSIPPQHKYRHDNLVESRSYAFLRKFAIIARLAGVSVEGKASKLPNEIPGLYAVSGCSEFAKYVGDTNKKNLLSEILQELEVLAGRLETRAKVRIDKDGKLVKLST